MSNTHRHQVQEDIQAILTKLVESECSRDKEEAKGLFRRDGGRAMKIIGSTQQVIEYFNGHYDQSGDLN